MNDPSPFVTLEEMLLCREARALRQKEILQAYSSPVISFTMNIPGPQKTSPVIRRAFRYGLSALQSRLPSGSVLFFEEKQLPTGCEAYFSVALPAETAKEICLSVEEECPVGRLFDLDVTSENGEKISRTKERGCLICGEKGRSCSRSRAHSVEELREKVDNLIYTHFLRSDSAAVASLATLALKNEVLTTPKPGLVDQRNTGSHKDMTLELFLKSAESLTDYFRKATSLGIKEKTSPPSAVFPLLRREGVLAEEKMFSVTGGVNTHKGAVFSMGILCCAVGRLWSVSSPVASTEKILSEASLLATEAARKDFSSPDDSTAGKRLYRSHGLTGVRGEAASGFSSVKKISLPVMERLLKEGKDLFDAGRTALIHLMAFVEDTTLYHRGGEAGAAFVKKAAKDLLDASPFPNEKALERLDDALIEKNLSPGGSADLLAVSYFLHSLGGLI